MHRNTINTRDGNQLADTCRLNMKVHILWHA